MTARVVIAKLTRMVGIDISNPIVVCLLIDAVLGDPPRLYRYIPHPVALLGRLIAFVEPLANRPDITKRTARLCGALAGLALIVAVGAFGVWIERVLGNVPYGWLIEAVVASTLIAFRSLYDHVLGVAHALESSLEAGRLAVSHIVGRDPEVLDESGVCRGAIESAAENFSDGVVAPVFWFVLCGLPGLFVYKTINTLDSMWGHRSPRFLYFGWFAARLDDWVNLVPARVAGLLFVLAAVFAPRASARGSFAAMWRDARRHRSPNAGWQESAVAGALGIAIAGPRQYHGEMVEDAWMGDGRRRLLASDIHAALHLLLIAGAGLLAVVVAMTPLGIPFVF